jgi:lipopolysaccharide transport system ATP-binding protein
MSSEIAIKVEGLSKVYQIYDKPSDRLKQIFARDMKRYYREFWALKDVSFEIHKGETVGIIGRNGSGKSTLLQMICGTLNPTAGSITTNGRIAALLELGSGFNPEFTGRENIALSATLLGLTPQEILKCAPEIEKFADIGDFIEQPVKTYSSGMFVRLAFAVNIMSNPEIMVVDEALAVGDMAFQAKCITALKKLQANGSTILFVSHDMASVKSLCDEAIYLDNGRIVVGGDAGAVSERYMQRVREEMSIKDEAQQFISNHAISELNVGCDASAVRLQLNSSNLQFFSERVSQFRYGTGSARILYAEVLNEEGIKISEADFNQVVKIFIFFESYTKANISVNYYIKDGKQNSIIGAGLFNLDIPLISASENQQYVAIFTTKVPLSEGPYSINVELTTPLIPNETAEFIDVINDAVVFRVLRHKVSRVWASVYVDNTVELIKLN